MAELVKGAFEVKPLEPRQYQLLIVSSVVLKLEELSK